MDVRRGSAAGGSASDGLRAKKKRPVGATTDTAHVRPVAPNHLERRCSLQHVGGIKGLWVSDVTYEPTKEDWLYLAVVLDLKSRTVVGWAMKDSLKGPLATDALTMALWRRTPRRELLCHSA